MTLIMALNDRTSLDDTRAQAMVFAQARLDPTPVTTDLTDARIAIRQALKTAREVPDETLQLLPLVPLVPRRALRRVIDGFLGSGDDLAVSCSNLGDIDPAVGRPDGTDAEYVMLRGIDQNVRRADIERAGGQLVVVAGRICGKMSINAVAYQPGAQNSKDRLREQASMPLPSSTSPVRSTSHQSLARQYSRYSMSPFSTCSYSGEPFVTATSRPNRRRNDGAWRLTRSW